MICNEAALERLEYPRLRLLLAGQTQSEPGRWLVEQLQPLNDSVEIEGALDEVDEAVRLLQDGQAPALGGCADLSRVLAQAQAAGSLLAAEELLQVGNSLQVAADCKSWFQAARGVPLLAGLAVQIVPLIELKRRLRDAIGARGDLLDSASFELGDIRYQLRQTRSRVKQQLEQLLANDSYTSCFQERLVTVRNGRYVVPVKADYRGQLKGFVQDESASGQTLYIEPAQVLDGNNRLQQLMREEQREERRILLQLADLVRRDSPVLQSNQRLLARIDLRLAAGRLSRQYDGQRPQLVAASIIELKQARHPLLMLSDGRIDPAKAVPIDILLPQECQALVISGPNTGGKSVALKTLGLLLLMLRSGLHLPCHADSRLHLYRRLHVDIGDAQSIAESLSTFSGHLLRIREILAEVDSETLVLLDEAGTGTDPAEGAALAQAVLDQLCAAGAKTLLTTHLGQLKLFAHSRAGIENAAVEFDPQTLAPRYRLSYGIPGVSSALATARRLGLPPALLQQAEQYLGQGEQNSSALLARLNRRQQQLEEELELAGKARFKAEQSQQLRKNQLLELQAKKRDILARASRQAEGLIADTEVRLKLLRKRNQPAVSPQQAVADKDQLLAARQQLEPYQPKPKRSTAVPRQLLTGELVRIVALGVIAQVERVHGGRVDLLVGSKRLRQPLKALEQFQPRRFAAHQQVTAALLHQASERVVRAQLKLIGQRVDEALPQLTQFIDDALLANLTQVEIIHGAGEGILRRVVRDFLARQSAVTAFYAAAIEQGGENVTIAELGEP